MKYRPLAKGLMKYLNKINYSLLIILFVFFTVFLSTINLGEAKISDWGSKLESGVGSTELYKTDQGDTKTAIAGYIGVLLQWTPFLGIPIMIHLLLGSYQWMTAAGNSEKVEAAKKRIRDALIGSLILVALYLIAYFFVQVLSSTTGYNVGG